ncbi:MAG TPA: extracellular solute-binding protein [Aggregatilineales bacterium]|nr:extracellular solute-binding protein [Aggregatilineales bacterium]
MRDMRVFPKRLGLGLVSVMLAAGMMVGSASAAALQATPAPTGAAASGGQPIPPFPSKPVTLQIIDVAGQQQLVQGMIDNYVKANPDKVSSVSWVKDTAPNLPGRIKAQQDAGKIDTSLVLTGYDGVASGVDQGIWLQIRPDYNAKFPGLDDNYLPIAKQYNDLDNGYAILDTTTPSGPLIEYDPSQVDKPPTTIDELKAWILANPGKFAYARPANSGPGRTFLQGLPYLLGDKDPKDPVNGWAKTWQFLKDIDPAIEYYTSGTSAIMQELGNGTRAMTVSTMGWDINPRVLGNVPKDFKVGTLKGFSFVADAQFVTIPKGLDADHLSVVLDLVAWMLKPDQQGITYDKGYFYPGPAIKGVDISMAPAASQQTLKDFGRPEYDDWIKSNPIVLPLDAKNLVAAFAMWDKQIGQSKVKVPPTPTPAPTKAP